MHYTRCLLGVAQGGFIPDVILYLSYFYTTSEREHNLAIFLLFSQYVVSVQSFQSDPSTVDFEMAAEIAVKVFLLDVFEPAPVFPNSEKNLLGPQFM